MASGVDWQLNPKVDSALVLRGLRLNINSVLYEEFLFRGYLLFQAIRWLGVPRGVLIGAVAFGIYHWFSYGIIGNAVQMAYVFTLTGGFGFMLALAFAKTKSMAAPIGLHLGWNLVAYLGFSGGPFGEGLLVEASGAGSRDVPESVQLALNLGLPGMLVLVTSWSLLRGRVNDGTTACAALVVESHDRGESSSSRLDA